MGEQMRTAVQGIQNALSGKTTKGINNDLVIL
jgi:hypothetical protein